MVHGPINILDSTLAAVPSARIITRRFSGGCVETSSSLLNPKKESQFELKKPASINTKPWVPWRSRPITNWSVTQVKALCKQSHVRVIQPQSIGGFCNGVWQGSQVCTTVWDEFIQCDSLPTFTTIDPGPNQALGLSGNKLLESLKDGKNNPNVSLGQALLERKQTERLFIDTIEFVAKSLRGFRKGLRNWEWELVKDDVARHNLLQKVQRRAAVLGGKPPKLSPYERRGLAVIEKWLAWQYGVKPLMQDVFDAMEAVDYFQGNELYSLSIRARARVDMDTVVTRFSNGSGAFSYELPIHWINRGQTFVEWKLKTGVLPALVTVGVTNPINLIYQVTPFSFILDWFVNLGSWFNLFDATIGKEFLNGYQTGLKVGSGRFQVVKTSGSQYQIIERGESFLSAFNLTRAKLASFPTPVPPAFKNPCSPTHVANALSLLAVAFGRGSLRRVPRMGR